MDWEVVWVTLIYVPDPGFVTIPAPDDEGLQALIAQKFRQNRKSIHIAYKFDNGWQTGKWESVSDRVTRADAAEKSVLLHIVKFNKDKRRYPLNLSLTTYGMDGKWCLVVEDDEPTRNKVDVDKMRSKKVRFHGFNYLKMLSASLSMMLMAWLRCIWFHDLILLLSV